MAVRPPWLVEQARRIATVGEHRVWRVRLGAGGDRGPWVAAKQFGPGRGFAQAVAARERVRDRGVAPGLLWVDRSQRLMVSEWIGESTVVSTDDWQGVGRALRRLHAVAPPDDPVPLGSAYQRRLESLLFGRPAELAAELGAAVKRLGLRSRFAALQPWLDAQPRVMCHRDVAPRNMRLVAAGAVRLLDFEHARGDLWLADWVKLAVQASESASPSIVPLVLEGYRGRGLDSTEAEALDALVGLFAVSTWAWGLRHGNTSVAGQGRRLVAAVSRNLS